MTAPDDPFVEMFRQILIGHLNQLSSYLPGTTKVTIFIRDTETNTIAAMVSHDDLDKVGQCLIKNRKKIRDGTTNLSPRRAGPLPDERR